MSKPMHLAVFMNFRSPAENRRLWSRADADNWTNGSFHTDVAQALERSGFDFIMLEDSSLVPDVYAGSLEIDLKHGLNTPKHDPVLLAARLSAVTRHIGLITTMSTSFYPPWLLARSIATLDHLTEGRAGWNIVTSSQTRAAQNFGMEKLPAHDLRYERAEEYLQLVTQLWEGWEPGARVMDEARGVYIDHTKVRLTNFEGQFFKCRGPLNTLPPLQGDRRPVLCQAGQSATGLAFAARWSNIIIVTKKDVQDMKSARAEIRDLARAAGRDPDHCKVMFLVEAHIGDSRADAEAKRDMRRPKGQEAIEIALGLMAGVTEIDFSQFELDAPLPPPSTQGHQGVLTEFLRMAAGRTLREVALNWNFLSASFAGTAEEVADDMEEMMDFVGGDGFLFSGYMSRAYISDLADRLMPVLQKRGLARTGYKSRHFIDNLLEF